MELTLDQALQKGIEAHKAGKVQEAEQYYAAILEANLKHPDANHNMGVLAVSSGKVEEAITFFKSALESNQSIAQFWLSYINALIKLDRIADAKAAFDEAKSKGAKGDAFDQIEKRFSRTNELDSEAIKIQEPPQETLQFLMNLYAQGQYQETLTQASQLLKKFSNSINLYNIIGAAKQSLGKPEEAIQIYKKVLSIRPNYADAYYNLGIAFKAQGKLGEAVNAYIKATSIKPNYAEAYNNMGLAFEQQGRLEEAINAYIKATSIKPDYAEAFYNLGITLRDNGKIAESIKAHTEATSLKPGFVKAYHGLAASLYIKGDLAGVMTNLKRINSITSEHDLEQAFYRLPYKVLKSLKYKDIDNVKGFKKSVNLKSSNKFPLIVKRKVEGELIQCLYRLSAQSLDETKDARYGSGKCSPDFKLFENDEPIIRKVGAEILQSMEKNLGGRVLYHESFFNILGSGGGTRPHDHIKPQDFNFDLQKYKFSLVYYLSIGDQNCTEPGILKLYDPNIDILPEKGMCVVIPASRSHSAIYNGTKDRMMIGCNFYLV